VFSDPCFETVVQLRYLIDALTQFVHQPRILHCDDRLLGKVLQQRDLLISERPYFLAECGNGAEDRTVSAKRDQHSAHAFKIDSGVMEGAYQQPLNTVPERGGASTG
jgi:hypothetical protein